MLNLTCQRDDEVQNPLGNASGQASSLGQYEKPRPLQTPVILSTLPDKLYPEPQAKANPSSLKLLLSDFLTATGKEFNAVLQSLCFPVRRCDLLIPEIGRAHV